LCWLWRACACGFLPSWRSALCTAARWCERVGFATTAVKAARSPPCDTWLSPTAWIVATRCLLALGSQSCQRSRLSCRPCLGSHIGSRWVLSGAHMQARLLGLFPSTHAHGHIAFESNPPSPLLGLASVFAGLASSPEACSSCSGDISSHCTHGPFSSWYLNCTLDYPGAFVLSYRVRTTWHCRCVWCIASRTSRPQAHVAKVAEKKFEIVRVHVQVCSSAIAVHCSKHGTRIAIRGLSVPLYHTPIYNIPL